MASIDSNRDMTSEQFAEYCDRSAGRASGEAEHDPAFTSHTPELLVRLVAQQHPEWPSGHGERPSTLQAAYDAGVAAGRALERAKPHQHTCWECGAKVPRKPEDIGRGGANTAAVVAAMAAGDPEPLLEMPDPYPVSHTPRTA